MRSRGQTNLGVIPKQLFLSHHKDAFLQDPDWILKVKLRQSCFWYLLSKYCSIKSSWEIISNFCGLFRKPEFQYGFLLSLVKIKRTLIQKQKNNSYKWTSYLSWHKLTETCHIIAKFYAFCEKASINHLLKNYICLCIC